MNGVFLNKLSAVISRNLGVQSADLFREFYQGDPEPQQMKGAEDLLADIIGRKKARDQLSGVNHVLREGVHHG